MSFDSGAPPETKKRTRPPVRAMILEKTSLAAIARRSLSPPGTGLPASFRRAVGLPDAEGPEEDLPPQRGALQDLVHDLGVDLLEDPGHADHDVRPDLQEVLGHGFDALGEGHRAALVDVREHDHPLEDMGQGQEGQDRVFGGELDDVRSRLDVADEVVMRQDDAFGDACRPRRVDQGRLVAGLDPGHERVEEARLGVRRGPALVHDGLQRQDARRGLLREGDVVPDLGEAGPQRLDLLPLVGVGDDDDGGVRIVDDVAGLLRDERRVDGHGQPAAGERRRSRSSSRPACSRTGCRASGRPRSRGP